MPVAELDLWFDYKSWRMSKSAVASKITSQWVLVCHSENNKKISRLGG